MLTIEPQLMRGVPELSWTRGAKRQTRRVRADTMLVPSCDMVLLDPLGNSCKTREGREKPKLHQGTELRHTTTRPASTFFDPNGPGVLNNSVKLGQTLPAGFFAMEQQLHSYRQLGSTVGGSSQPKSESHQPRSPPEMQLSKGVHLSPPPLPRKPARRAEDGTRVRGHSVNGTRGTTKPSENRPRSATHVPSDTPSPSKTTSLSSSAPSPHSSNSGQPLVLAAHFRLSEEVNVCTKIIANELETTTSIFQRLCQQINNKHHLNLVYYRIGLAVCDQRERETLNVPPPGTCATPTPTGNRRRSHTITTVTSHELYTANGMAVLSWGPVEEKDSKKGLLSFLKRAGSSRRPESTSEVPASCKDDVIFATEHPFNSIPYVKWCIKKGRDIHFDLHPIPPPSLCKRRPFGKELQVKV